MGRIQAGNEQFVNVLFIVPLVIDKHGYRFKIFTLVSEIHENIHLSNEVVFLWNRTLAVFVDKLSSTTVYFIMMKSTVVNESLSTNAT